MTLDNTQASTIISPYSRLESISREVFSSLIYAPAAHDSSCESLRQTFLTITPAKHHSHGPIIGRTFKRMIATLADNRNPDENLSFRLPVQSSAPHGFKFPGADLVQSILVWRISAISSMRCATKTIVPRLIALCFPANTSDTESSYTMPNGR